MVGMCVYNGKGFFPPYGEDKEVSPDYFLWLALAVCVVICLRAGLDVKETQQLQLDSLEYGLSFWRVLC